MKKILIALGILSLFAACTAAIGGNNSTQTASNSAPTTQKAEAKPAESGAAQKGQWVDVRNDRQVQVNESETVQQIASSNQFMKPVASKGGKLVVVYMTLKNTGNESGNMFWTKFQLVDSQGRKYEEIADFEEIVTINTWMGEKNLEDPASQVFPGGTAKTAKVFRVSPDAEGLTLDAG